MEQQLEESGYSPRVRVIYKTGGVVGGNEATTRKAQVNGNSLNLFLGAAVGLAQTDISTVAIAWANGGSGDYDCFQNGMIAGGSVGIQGGNAFTNNFCVYGDCGIEIFLVVRQWRHGETGSFQ